MYFPGGGGAPGYFQDINGARVLWLHAQRAETFEKTRR